MNSRLLLLRTQRNWSQAKLASESGISQPVIHRLEAGTRKWLDEDIQKIAKALGVTPSALFDDKAPVGDHEHFVLIAERSVREVLKVCQDENFMPDADDFAALVGETIRAMLENPSIDDSQVRSDAAKILKFQARRASR